ncbi:immunoglobulin superfamily member 11 isoform X2 [Takifugu flavidus]|uniref:immunoglobulin superfamily member 11 isoform X2 n=2 Tax=Takifugu flavidus TaxID=433684 RepID=UPI00254471C6|nr:immunoglobulin superfamily member 11 isoform X2 [Takifugu flavidus]
MGSSAGWMLCALCACFGALENDALRVTMRESRLKVVQGDFVVLPCSFFTSSPLSRLNIIWTMAPSLSPENPTQVIVYDHGQVIEDPALTGRVGFTGVPWSADIMLNDTRVSDAGIYRCMVNNPPETPDPGIGELELSVVAPPSLPVCQWDGVVDVGGSVTLSCSVAEGTPAPQIRWTKLNPEVELPINMDGDLSGSVQIANVSSQTSGLYRCSATNLLGTEHCYVNLSVYSAPGRSSGVLQGVLLTSSMCLVLLALLLLLLWLRRSGTERHQDGGRKPRAEEEEEEEEEECYNEIRYTPSVVKRSFV